MPLTRPPSTIILNPNTDFGSSERPGKNKLINGNFDFWQRSSSLAIAGSEYVSDRWLSLAGDIGGSATISRQLFAVGQSDVPNNPKYFMRHVETGIVGGVVGFEQRIENVGTLNNQSIAVSFWAKVGSGSMDVTPKLVQNFGTTGSPSSDVVTSGTAISVNTLWNKYTAIFAVPSISGKILGSDGNDFLSLQLLAPVSTIFTLDVSQVQLEKGLIATEYDNRPLGYELSLCQRYYEKSYNVDVNPGTITGNGMVANITILVGNDFIVNTPFKNHKRSNPSVSIFNHVTGTINSFRNITDSVNYTVSSVNDIGEGGFSSLTASSGISTNRRCGYHFVADAEL